MGFCKGALSTVRKIWLQITPILEKVIDTVLEITQALKDLAADQTVIDILTKLNVSAETRAWLNSAIDEITGIANDTRTLEEKITEWLASLPTEAARDAGVFKLASMAVKHSDIQAKSTHKDKTDSFYDSAIQLSVIIKKGD